MLLCAVIWWIVIIADAVSAVGLLGLAVLPSILPPYTGLQLSVVLYSIGAGLMEVLISPIVDLCQTDDGRNHMSLLHSFYCWGFAGVVLLSTAYFRLVGIENWRILACLWAILPIANAVTFARVPIRTPAESKRWSIRALASQKTFWVFVLLMLCAGATEVSISQWISAFVESGLQIPKSVSDLVGPCLFAVLMAVSRMLFSMAGDRLSHLPKYMAVCGGLSIIGYLMVSFTGNQTATLLGYAVCGFSVSIMWPGTISLAADSSLSSTAMFALLALAGDVGCVLGPSIVGIRADRTGSLQAGLSSVVIFPVVLTFVLMVYSFKNRQEADSD